MTQPQAREVFAIVPPGFQAGTGRDTLPGDESGVPRDDWYVWVHFSGGHLLKLTEYRKALAWVAFWSTHLHVAGIKAPTRQGELHDRA